VFTRPYRTLALHTRLRGLLLGTAVGDAVGLPAEGLSPRRIARRWPGPLRHALAFGRGFVSDDTEHTFFVAQALLAAPDDAAVFQRALAWKLRWWLLALPGGIGFATLRAILRLWCGFPSSRAGVWSAGNGPAMRSAIIGARFCEDPERLRAYVLASTRLTHTDPRAAVGALAVANAAAWAVTHDPVDDASPIVGELAALAGADPEWTRACDALGEGLRMRRTVAEFAAAIGCERGVTGYVYHTVPVALYAWLRHRGDFRGALAAVVACGGDTDTVGAITGAVVGASGAGIPPEWVAGIADWPVSTTLLARVGVRLADAQSGRGAGPVAWAWPGLLVRNPVFLAIVFAHQARRLFPPW
jgi:ADP-ribosylglycohydrolase